MTWLDVGGRITASWHWSRKKIVELNRFESVESHTDAFALRTEILATRLYLALLTVVVVIIVFHLSLDVQTWTVAVPHPSQATYEYLEAQYSSTLKCSCEQISIPFRKFMTISVTYHPVCSSSFVSDRWVDMLFSPDQGDYYPVDFRASASGQFQVLQSLCGLANASIADELDTLLDDTALLSDQLINAQNLEVQGSVSSLFFRTSTENKFLRTLRLIRGTTAANNLQSAFQIPATLVLEKLSPDEVDIAVSANGLKNQNGTKLCLCHSQATCSINTSGFFSAVGEDMYGILYIPETRVLAFVPGFVVGCFALESLLQARLICLFNQMCVDIVQSFFVSTNTNFVSLDSTKTRFDPESTTVEMLVNELFVEQWLTRISFSQYYAQCAPISCLYSYSKRNDILYVTTTVLGLYGGLTVVLRLIVPRLVKCVRDRRRTPITTAETIPINDERRKYLSGVFYNRS
ncbi:unnamed protein product [Adineta ricciae]|uniref:Uncharacterized protein n=1 Tax=Adineta ricciae TaxID=249248 RepID=A0A815MXG3_ADIRI|nr:unnamed protein product [Adineta ricciae]CAF1605900.1 unnamed protein product [Adineta ricciae]